MLPNTQLFVAVKALIVHEGRVLLLREATQYADGTHVGEYDLPGGRIEPSEDLLTALKREVKEETGLVVLEARPIDVTEWWPQKDGKQWHIVGIFYHTVVASPHPVALSPDHDSYMWHPIGAPLPSNLIPMYKPLLERVSV